VKLESGLTVAVYGRPGFFLRASADPSLAHWEDPVTVIPPGGIQSETCSYGDLIALGGDEGLVVYSDFQYPNDRGEPCKTILSRRFRLAERT